MGLLVVTHLKVDKGIYDDLRHFWAIFRAPENPRGTQMDDLVCLEKLRGNILLWDDSNTEKMAKILQKPEK